MTTPDTSIPNLVASFLSGIPYCRASGMSLVSIEKGRASLKLPGSPTWTGDAQRQLIHPGCSSVLADSACGMAVSSSLDTLEPIATLDLRMDYLRPATAGADLICEAHCYRLTRHIAFVRGDVFQSGDAEPVAAVIAAFMRGTASGPRDPSASRPAAAPNLQPGIAIAVQDPPQQPALPIGMSPYVEYLDVRQARQPDGVPLFRLPFRPDLIGNPLLPALHGGVLAGFAETAMVLHLALTASQLPDSPARGVDFSIDYLRSAKPVDTYARCVTIRRGSRVALVQAELWQDDPLRPVATVRGHLLLPDQAG